MTTPETITEAEYDLGWGAEPGHQPSGKAARAALKMLAEVTSAVVQVTCHTWRVVSKAVDLPDEEQLELAFDSKGKGESPPEPAQPARPARPRTPRARARASVLERVWGREPVELAGRRLARAVEQLGAVELGAVELGTARLVTLTVPDGVDATATAEAFAALARAAGAAVELVAERAPATGHLHYHGIAVVPDEALGPDDLDGAEALTT